MAAGAGSPAGTKQADDDAFPKRFTCTVENTGRVDGAEVVMVYHAAGAGIRSEVDHPVPIRALVYFERVHLPASGSMELAFTLGAEAFCLTNATGARVLFPGERLVTFSRGSGRSIDIPVIL